MSILKPALENSWIARPFVRLANVSSQAIASWAEQSHVGGFLTGLTRPFENTGNHPLLNLLANPVILQVMVTLLFIISTLSETTWVGALTLGIMAYILLLAVFKKIDLLDRLNIVDILVLAFFGSALISTGFSSYFKTSVIGMAKMSVFLASYWVFRTAVKDALNQKIVYFFAILFLLGVTQSCVGFYQYFGNVQPTATWQDPTLNPELNMTRIWGSIPPHNPNLLAGFLITTLASATGLLLLLFNKRSFTKKSVLLILAVILGAGAIKVAMILTASRGAYLALASMFGLFVLLCGHWFWHEKTLKDQKWLKILWVTIVLGALLGVAGVLIKSEALRHRVTSIFAMREDSSISYRFNVYGSAIRMFKDNPVVGIGPGNETFKLVYGLYMIPGYNALGAYSVPLEIAVEQGIIGLTFFLLLIGVIKIRTALATDEERPHENLLNEKLILGALLLGIVGSFIYGIFDTIWYRPAVNLQFWFFVAAFGCLSEKMLYGEKQ